MIKALAYIYILCIPMELGYVEIFVVGIKNLELVLGLLTISARLGLALPKGPS